MRNVIRIILTVIAICTVAIPDMASEVLKKIKKNVRDIKVRTTENLNDLAKGLGKSSTEKTR